MKKKAVKPKLVKKEKTGSIDTTFLVLVLTLVVFGLVMLFSASYAYAYYNFKGDSLHFIKRQMIWAVLGIVAMLIVSRIDYHILHRIALPLYIIVLGLLVVVLFMPPLNNAKRWIFLPGGLTFQPSELAKFAIVLVFAHFMSLNYKRMKTFGYGVLPYGIMLGLVALLMLQEPHLSGTILIMAIGFTMMVVGGTAMRWFIIGGSGVVAVLAYVVLFTDMIEYAMPRIQMWLDPFQDASDTGFQTVQSLLAIGSGGLMGVGLGKSRQKYLYVPEPQNDFIFSILCEELGFIGAALVILLFALFIWRGFVIAMRAKDKFGALLTVGLTVQVGLQALLNIAVVTNAIPNTGISLPFFSYGGTSLFMLLAQMGVVLSVSRQSKLEKT